MEKKINNILLITAEDGTLYAIESAEEGAEVEAALAAFDAQQSNNT